MRRGLALVLLLSTAAFAQMPRGLYPWWNRPAIRQDLKLTNQQQRQIRMTVTQYRGRLIEIRAEVNRAEIDLQAQFEHDPVDQARANQAIERVIAARSDLTRALSQLSLKLRTVLSEQQWQQLQRFRPPVNDGTAQPTEFPPQK
ncbi:MAG: periplasmic heavy metal sensor [Acidobacteriia bacterium]|nr:periplasmic heavy metal sensor [Terriglobia bacterium]